MPVEPTTVKGKTEPIEPYKVFHPRKSPPRLNRFSGLRAELICLKGRWPSCRRPSLHLKEGKGTIFSLVGDAGTGKSRLVEDFKATVEPGRGAVAGGTRLRLFPEHALFSPDRPSQQGLADQGGGRSGRGEKKGRDRGGIAYWVTGAISSPSWEALYSA